MEAASTAWGPAEKPAAALATVYDAVAEWLLYPPQIGPGWEADGERTEVALAAARLVGPEVEAALRRFGAREPVGEEEYVRLFELQPRYPLHLGTHLFEEPSTCSAAGVSDRNTFMLEIANVYRHFGFVVRGELPDHLAVMVEFLAITAGCAPHDDEVRVRLIDKLMIEGLRALGAAMEGGDAPPHEELVEALLGCLERELRGLDGGVDLVGTAVAAAPSTPPIRILEVPGA